MEIIDDGNSKFCRQNNSTCSALGAAVILIAAGAILLGYNLGFIDRYIYRILISWQMLLIVLGFTSLIKGQTSWGLVLFGIGVIFLIPRFTGPMYDTFRTYWPLAFIAAGVVIIIKAMVPSSKRKQYKTGQQHHSYSKKTEDGYVDITNHFGSITQMVLDPVFKGGKINNRFGETILDLRRTNLAPGDTFLDIQNMFGGVEIYVKESWKVKNEINPVLSGVDDKRYNVYQGEESVSTLVIRGTATFSGIEIKC